MTRSELSRRRRTVLKGLGVAGTVGVGAVASAAADGPGRGADRGELRLLGEAETPGARQVTTQGRYAYVATNDRGLAVIDWRNPGRPEVVADIELPGEGIWDVKVDGDLLVISSQWAGEDEDPAEVIGTHVVDVSDPTDPERLSTWTELPAGIHNHYLDGKVAYLCRHVPFDDSALRILDLSDPSDPTELAEWRVEDEHPELEHEELSVNFTHDVYVQDDLAYLAYWNAGTRILDVSDPSDPVEVGAVGETEDADVQPTPEDYAERLLALPGNHHYVQPSPDGDHLYVGAETFPGVVMDDPGREDYGPVWVYDISDLDDTERVATILPPDVDRFRTAHNFDVTANRIHTTWYDGGIQVHDVTDPAKPEKRYRYRPEGSSFWTCDLTRSVTVASDIGRGVVFLHADRGQRRPPAFEGAGPDSREFRPDDR